jgi:hypothetical protein
MIPIDGDMVGFIWSTARVLLRSKSHLRKNTRPIPVRYQRQLLDDSELTEQQGKYISPIDAKLAGLGFLPFYTYRITNFGANLVRGYQNLADTASCTVTIIEVRVKVDGVTAVKNSQMVNFTSRFSDGKELTTRNMAVKSLMDPPAHKIMQECPHVTNLGDLKGIHDAKAASLGTPLAPPREVQGVIAEFDKDHERFSKYQVERGIYELSPQGDVYRLTDKAFNRGIQNYFNPFARRISVEKILFSALVGAVLPLYGILKLAPDLRDKYGATPQTLIHPATLAILACYVLAGVLMGLVTESQKFIWVMLVTYIPAHLMAGWTFGFFPYSTTAFLVSFWVCQAKRKRYLVLQS